MTSPGGLSRRVRLAAGLLLVAFVLQAAVAAVRDSVTIDEFVPLAVGLHAVRTGDVSLLEMNPPFFPAAVAWPVSFLPVRLAPDPDRSPWGLGYQLMFRNAQGYQALYVCARLVVIAVGAALGAALLAWATALYGWPTGLTTLFLYAFSPSILAHAHLVTYELAATVGVTAVVIAGWWFVVRPGSGRAVVLGVAAGTAPLFKFSGVLGSIGVLLVVALRMLRRRGAFADTSPGRRVGLGLLAVVVAIATVNAPYGFGETFATLGSLRLPEEGALGAIAARWPWLRVPLPGPLVRSLDLLLTGDQASEPTYFLAGELSREGWWYYHPVAFALKTPLPLLGASLWALAGWIRGRVRSAVDDCLFVPMLCFPVGITVLNPLDIGVRHLLPAYPLLFVTAGAVLAAPIRRWFAARERRSAVVLVPTAALAWFLAGSLAVSPQYLRYFNELAGGPEQGYRWLIDSNVDWGQDLIRLRETLRERGEERVHLAYFGRVNPLVYGIPFEPLRRDSEGLAAVSASFLMGRPYVIWNGPRRLDWAGAGEFTWLQEREPVDRVGALFLYRLGEGKAEDVSTEGAGSRIVNLRRGGRSGGSFGEENGRHRPPPGTDAWTWGRAGPGPAGDRRHGGSRRSGDPGAARRSGARAQDGRLADPVVQ